MVAVGLFSIGFSPIAYFLCDGKDEGDIPKKEDKKVETTLSQSFVNFVGFAYAGNIDQRNRIMARTSVEILTEGADDLLIVCGEEHVDGIIENLKRKLEKMDLVADRNPENVHC